MMYAVGLALGGGRPWARGCAQKQEIFLGISPDFEIIGTRKETNVAGN
jgi:hypothetical protein